MHFCPSLCDLRAIPHLMSLWLPLDLIAAPSVKCTDLRRKKGTVMLSTSLAWPAVAGCSRAETFSQLSSNSFAQPCICWTTVNSLFLCGNLLGMTCSNRSNVPCNLLSDPQICHVFLRTKPRGDFTHSAGRSTLGTLTYRSPSQWFFWDCLWMIGLFYS